MGFRIALAFSAFACAQNLAPIRVDVRLVTASFTARDARGVLVADLKKEEIELIDDGIPQSVSFFSRSADVPLSLGLIVDASGSQQHFMKDHEHDLQRFLKVVLTPRDRAFLLCFGNHLRIAQEDTSSPGELIEGLKRFEKDRNREELAEIGPPDLRFAGTAFYDALYYSTTEKLRLKESGRRALIVFSDGEDNSSAHHMLDVIEAAQGSGVVIFGVRYTESRRGRVTARNKYGTSVMARLARETGGADFDAEKDDLQSAFRQIGEQLRTSYEIAYHPSGVANDGAFHKLVIRARGGEIAIRAKTGYYSKP